ncbi:hypothetical protein, conserved [Leishmania tarentolae]|uniref:Tubulin epsilon and delta complex protein 1 domain-containing protein n=1 Tax=Leishmania tarentolae TaxID=5689 RepID=A0A640KGX3_LEITA|nr:hypothetical protein, conserved [Leishmania tarentolae]
MRQDKLSRRRTVRLVQPFHDSADAGGDDLAFRAATMAVQSSAPRDKATSSSTASQLTPIQLRGAGVGACADDAPSLSTAQTPPSSVSSPEVRPSCPTRAGGPSGSNAAPHGSSVSSSHSYLQRDGGISSAFSSAQPVSSSVDRLAALYQQFQLSQERDSHAPRRGTADRSREVVIPTQPKNEALAEPVLLSWQPSRMSASGDSGATDKKKPHRIPPSGGPSTLARLPRPASKDDEAHATHPHEDVFKAECGDLLVRRIPAPLRTTTSASVTTPTPSQQSAEAPPLASRSPLSRATVALPPSLSATGIPALMHIAARVWAALGFFEMRWEERAQGDEGKEAEEVSPYATGPSSPEDAESFLWGLEEYLNFYRADSPGPSAAVLAEVTALLRNGLWRVLFNAVFYCLTVLDKHRHRRGPLSDRETEVQTGGTEDEYEVVYSSSSDADGEDAKMASLSRETPVRLVWKYPGESDEERLARCVRDPLPSNSPLWSGSPSTAWERGAGSSGLLQSDLHSIERSSRRPLDEVYGGRLRTALPIADWYLILRCLAQVGYRRDVFYLQTPFDASPHELLLVLLWLTQQYKMLAVAEYVELNRRYAFLLQYHVDEAFLYGSAVTRGSPRPACVTARERLLYQLSHSSAWPPVSFDENATIAVRLAQLERCLGKGTASGGRDASAQLSVPTAPPAATLHVRRLMAVRRLLGLSFNRLHQALQRQAEQVTFLGLHSPLDAQLCRKQHHALYEEAIAGLAYVEATQQRLQTTVDNLAKAGSLVAFLLRYEELTVSAEEVLLGLEEDDATWLSHDDPAEGDASDTETRRARGQCNETEADRWRRAVRRGKLPVSQSAPESAPAVLATSAASLAQAISRFRATHVRATLTETWRRLLRCSHVAPQTVPPESLRFLLDTEAQQVQEARVRENMRYRYSLQAALAAELAVLGHQTKQRRRGRHFHSLLQGGDDSVLSTANLATETRSVEDSKDIEVRPVQVALPPLDLVTSASTAFAQLRSEEAVYGSVTLGSAELQLTEVGEPTAGSTTSARLELERLQAWEGQLDAQLGVQAQTAARMEYCKGLLHALYHQSGLRIATPVAQKPSSQQLPSVK